jgi:hypothetical protein
MMIFKESKISTSKIVQYCILLTLTSLMTGCGYIDLSPKIKVEGKVVKIRSKEPVEGVSIVTYKQLFNCGALCNTYKRTGDSTGTDEKGNFSFEASETDLILGVFKEGYFGIFPGYGILDSRRILGGKNDFGAITLIPYGELDIKLRNTGTSIDSYKYKIFSCGNEVNTGSESLYTLRSEAVIRWPIEAECTIDLYITLIRNGKESLTKESFYLDRGEVKHKTIDL